MELPKLHLRELDTHKNDFGRVFVLAGSKGMVGAALLTAEACLRSGAGYACLGLPESLLATVSGRSSASLCVIGCGLPETEEGSLGLMAKNKVLEQAASYDVLALGPGLSQNPQTQQMLSQLLPEVNQALIVDADGLNALAKNPELTVSLQREKGLPIFTPHPGEFSRLVQRHTVAIEHPIREQECREFAARNKIVCVLKGYRSVVSDGEQTYINATGNPGMATAGSGDVLTGTIAALRGQGFDSFEAACLGVYIHGLAGDMVAERLGIWGMTAYDILNELPLAFKRYDEEKAKAAKNSSEKEAINP